MTASTIESLNQNKKVDLAILDSDVYLTVIETARLLEINKDTCMKYIKRGTLKTDRIGNLRTSQYRIKTQYIREFMNYNVNDNKKEVKIKEKENIDSK